jgi:hypothetical protein
LPVLPVWFCHAAFPRFITVNRDSFSLYIPKALSKRLSI